MALTRQLECCRHRQADDGYITRTAGPDGRSVITAMSSGVHQPSANNKADGKLAQKTMVARVANTCVPMAEHDEHPLFSPALARLRVPIIRIVVGFAFAALSGHFGMPGCTSRALVTTRGCALRR